MIFFTNFNSIIVKFDILSIEVNNLQPMQSIVIETDCVGVRDRGVIIYVQNIGRCAVIMAELKPVHDEMMLQWVGVRSSSMVYTDPIQLVS